MNPVEPLLAALPWGVVEIGALMLLVMGLALVGGGVHCWIRWRKLTK